MAQGCDENRPELVLHVLRFLLFPELRAALSHQLGTVLVPGLPFSQDIPDPRSQSFPARLHALMAFSLDFHYSTAMITLVYGYLSFLTGVQAMMTFCFLPAPSTLNRKAPNNFCRNHVQETHPVHQKFPISNHIWIFLLGNNRNNSLVHINHTDSALL